MSGMERLNIGPSMTMIQEEGCKVLMMQNDTGEGVMTIYEVMDGVYLLYSDLHMEHAVGEVQHKTDLLCMDYCIEGHMEWALEEGIYYQKPGDLNIDMRDTASAGFYLPLRHYLGVLFAPGAGICGESFPRISCGHQKRSEKICRKNPRRICSEQ